MPPATLDELRDELNAVDRELLAAVARRQALVERIGRVKQHGGRGTRDFSREKVVIEQARAAAAALDLAPDLAEHLMRLLIEHSLTAQEQNRVAAQGGGGGRRVLLIGGAGQMGRWFARFLTAQDFSVEIADPAGPVEGFPHVESWTESALDAYDFIIVAASIRATGRVLRQLAERRPAGVVFDISSLKSPLRPGLEALRTAGVRATSVHPMFGPDTELLSGRHVVFIDLGAPEALAAARALFESTMAVSVEMSLEAHDRAMAFVLGLSHAVNLAFSDALVSSGADAPDLARISSTTFDAQLGVARQVARENPHLYFEIQALNDYGMLALEQLATSVERLRALVRAGEEEEFAKVMRRGYAYFEQRTEAAPASQAK